MVGLVWMAEGEFDDGVEDDDEDEANPGRWEWSTFSYHAPVGFQVMILNISTNST